MIDSILRFSIRNRTVIVILSLFLIGIGVWSATQLPLDAVPDITPKQVLINASAPALGPQDVERRITFPLETAVAGLPHVVNTRSISQFGLSQVTVTFDDNTDIYFDRQLVNERMQTLNELPPGVKPVMGPISTGLGEIYQFRLRNAKDSLMNRRTIMDWMVVPRLRSVSGLAGVNVWGGVVKQYQVLVDPNRLLEYGLSYDNVFAALENNNQNAGGAYITKGAEQRTVGTVGMVHSIDDIRNIVIAVHQGVPVTIARVAKVKEGGAIRQGACTQDGKGEQVYGVALLLMGRNARVVTQHVKAKLAEIQKSLPPGTTLIPFLDRSKLIDRVVHTAISNLIHGGLLVIIVLFLFLLQLRAGLIVSSAIPIAMLIAIIGMRYYGISANLMSLGAIDFGMIVDGAVIIVENCMRRLSERREELGRDLTESERLDTIYLGSMEVRKASQFGEMIIIAAYIPILSLSGVEGKMFRPMGFVVIFALIGALILSLTLIPALSALFLRARRESPNIVLSKASILYEHTLKWAMDHRYVTVGGALVFFVVCATLFRFLGSEFIPKLEEGAILIEVRYPTSISLNEAIQRSSALESLIREKFPDEVNHVVSHIGRAEVATEPNLVCQADESISLKPISQWKQAHSEDELVRRMSRALKEFPGARMSFNQPINQRMMELMEGIGLTSDVGIKIFGTNPQVLASLAAKVAHVTRSVRGSADVHAEVTQGLPQLQIKIRRDEIARYGVSVDDVNRIVVIALGGKTATTLTKGVERFQVAVRLPSKYRDNAEKIGRILVPGADGGQVPLSMLADIHSVEGPVQINHENGQRFVSVQANVRGRDLGGFVQALQSKIGGEVRLPVGYHIEYGGTYEMLQAGRARLMIAIPVTFALIFLLLYSTFGSLKQTALVFTGIPFAVTGGVLSLLMRGMPMSISAGIGFIALFGVAVLNGVVLVMFINSLREQGAPVRDAVLRGALTRLRPVLMTAAVASIGFIPMAISTSAGAEVQKPLATVVIGGLITSTLLTLFVLPTLYAWVEKDKF